MAGGRKVYYLKPNFGIATSAAEKAFIDCLHLDSLIKAFSVISDVSPLVDLFPYAKATTTVLKVNQMRDVMYPTCVSADYPFDIMIRTAITTTTYHVLAGEWFYMKLPCIMCVSVQNSYRFKTFVPSIPDTNLEKLQSSILNIIKYLMSDAPKTHYVDSIIDQGPNADLCVLMSTDARMFVDGRELGCLDQEKNPYPFYIMRPDNQYRLVDAIVIPADLANAYIKMHRLITAHSREGVEYKPIIGSLESVFSLDDSDDDLLDLNDERPPSRTLGPSSIGSCL